jgi:hypothetical protein
MDIHVKKSTDRVDDPRRHPTYERDRKIGERNLREGKMKFENDAQRRDYFKAVESNPLNVAGIPAFAPPLQIKSYIDFTLPELSDEEKLKIRFDTIRTIFLYCSNCRSVRESSSVARVSEHNISKTDCFCKTCGKHKDFRIK